MFLGLHSHRRAAQSDPTPLAEVADEVLAPCRGGITADTAWCSAVGHPDLVWYLAYGSNMHHSAFRERRGMQPSEWRVARVTGYRLRFNLEGRPKGKAAPANICPDPDCEMWGVLYRITRRELLRLDSTEGVPGRHYRHRPGVGGGRGRQHRHRRDLHGARQGHRRHAVIPLHLAAARRCPRAWPAGRLGAIPRQRPTC